MDYPNFGHFYIIKNDKKGLKATHSCRLNSSIYWCLWSNIRLLRWNQI